MGKGKKTGPVAVGAHGGAPNPEGGRPSAPTSGKHARIGLELGKLVDAKDRAYGQAVAIVPAILRLLYPDGIRPEQYLEAALIVRMEDKICRIARGDARAFKESPWRDICGYSMRGIEMEGKEDL
jgi:hypothetical protein